MLEPGRIATLYTVALLLVVFLQGLSDDLLLFHSDWLSYLYFTSALVLLLFILIVGVVLGTRLLPAIWRHKALQALDGAVVMVTLAGCVVFGVETISGKIEDIRWLSALLIGSIVFGSLILRSLRDIPTVRNRVRQFAGIATAVGLVVFAGGLAYAALSNLAKRTNPDGMEKHVILLVIDGMPSQLLSTYNQGAEETALDRVMKQGLVFTNVRTNKVYTNGFFSVLYSGRMNLSIGGRGEGGLRHNLLNVLQEHGVTTRWISFHASGLPESNSVTQYTGLRSAFVTENWNWLPAYLGLNYHTFVAWEDSRKYMGERTELLYRLTNGRLNEDILWSQNIPRQVAELHSNSNKSFLLVHVSFGEQNVQALADKSEGASTLFDFYQRAIKNDYRYQPEDEPLVEHVRQEYRARADEYGKRIQQVLDYLGEHGWSSNTLVIMTADHGSILSKGKIWYGYHNEEEVTRVPLVIFGPGALGHKHRLADTRDVRRTLLDYFEIDGGPDGMATSLISSGVDKSYVPVLTIPSQKYRQHFLNVYAKGRKFVVNIHPQGHGENWWGVVDGYKVGDVHAPIEPDDPVWGVIGESLMRFGVSADTMHVRYRPLVKMNRHGNQF